MPSASPPSGASSVAQLTDVDLTSPPISGQALVWNAAGGKWKPGTVAVDLSAYLKSSDAASTYATPAQVSSSVASAVSAHTNIATGINAGHVIRLVSGDLTGAIEAQFSHPSGRSAAEAEAAVLPPPRSAQGEEVRAGGNGGYLQALDVEALLRLAQRHGAVICLTVRPGKFVFPGMIVAHTSPAALSDVRVALVTGPRRTSSQDVEFAARQLVEVAVRALSSGINDPFTAIAVLDHLGAALCRVSGREMPPSEFQLDGRLRLVVPVTDYDGLTDVMFHQIRQNGAEHPAVMLRVLEVLAAVGEQERRPERRASLRRHADLTLRAALRETQEETDRRELEERHERMLGVLGRSR